LTFSLYLKASDDHGEGFKYFPYLDAGEVLDPGWLEPLAKVQVKSLYFHNADLENVLAYLNNHLQLLEMEGAAQTKRKFNVLTEHLILSCSLMTTYDMLFSERRRACGNPRNCRKGLLRGWRWT
jgi:hypothetical protein